MRKTRIYFRADANSRIGFGHVSRLLSLAEHFRKKYECIFLTRTPIDAVTKSIKDVCSAVIVLPNTYSYDAEAKFICTHFLQEDDIVITDGYSFKSRYQKTIKQHCAKLVCVDDEAKIHFYADSIVNHAGVHLAANYSKEKYTRLFLGLQYAMVRKVFKESQKKTLEPVKEIFVAMGGSKKQTAEHKVIKALTRAVPYCIIHVVKPDHSLKSEENIIYHSQLSPPQMARLMRTCQMAICPASTLSLEALHVGLPVFTLTTSRNQENIERTIKQIPWVTSVGNLKKCRKKMLESELKKFVEKITKFTGKKAPVLLSSKNSFERIIQ